LTAGDDGTPLSGDGQPGPPLLPVPSDPDTSPGPSGPTVPTRPGVGTFTIEGRAAPGLFVVGWLATISGLALILIGALAPSGPILYFVGPAVLTVGLVAGAGNQALERRARGEPYAGPSPYLVFAAILSTTFAAAYVVGLILHLVLGSIDVPDELVALIAISLQALVFFGILRLTVVGTGALSWAEMGWRRFDTEAVRDLLRGLAYAVPVIFVTGLLANALVSAFGVEPESPLPATGTATGLLLELLAGALIAPLAEEAVFRGFAITAWERTVGVRGAIVRASLLFALAHVINISGNPDDIVGLTVIGFVTRLPVAFALGWLFVRQRSIWAPLGLHMSFNGILLILSAIDVASRAATG
jgi:membrane protease YdiL (CAAX protease family)